MDKYLNQFGILTDNMFVRADSFWSQLSSSLPDLHDPVPILKLSAFLMTFSFVSSFLPPWLAMVIAALAVVAFILTFFDWKPKQWSGASAQREYAHSWMTRMLLAWLIFSTILSSFLGEEYADSIFVAHIIVIIYPVAVVLGIIAFAAQVELQSSYGRHNEHRYRPISRHED